MGKRGRVGEGETMDPVLTLAEHVCPTRVVDLPASAVVATKRDILDALGAA